MTRSSKLAVVVLLGILVVGGLVLRSVAVSKRARQELATYYAQVKLGTTKEEAARVFSSNDFRRVRLVEVSDDLGLLQTPLEWGAGNWVLRLEFDKQRLVAAKVRLHDDASIRPASGPRDKIAGQQPENP